MSIGGKWQELATLNTRDPFASWEVVDVQFPSTPHSDYVIRHTLTPQTPKDTHYRIIRQHTSGTIYEAPDSIWGPHYIVLRSDTPSWTGRLLIGTLDKPQVFDASLIAPTSSAVLTAGAWTPTLQFGGGSTGMTYSTRIGAYRVVGNTSGERSIIYQGAIALSAKGSSTGSATITGLPESTLNNTRHVPVTIGTYINMNVAVLSMNAWIAGSSATIILEQFGAGACAALAHGSFADNSILVFGGSHPIAG